MVEKLSRLQDIGKLVQAQCRDASCLGASNLSWCRIFIACRCGSPGASLSTSLSMASRGRNDGRRMKERKTFELISHLRFMLGWRVRHQAKTVTNNLPLLSVLAVAFIYLSLKQSLSISHIFLLLFSNFSLRSDD